MSLTGIGGDGTGPGNVLIRHVRFVDLDDAVAPDGDNWRIEGCHGNIITNWVSATAGHDFLKIEGCLTSGQINLNGSRFVEIVGNRLRSLIDAGTGGESLNVVGNIIALPGGNIDALIDLHDSVGFNVVGNVAYDSSGYEAILADGASDGLIDANVFGNVTAGIQLANGSAVKVSGNVVGANGYLGEHGVHMSAMTDSDVVDNTILSPGQDAVDTYDGVLVDGTSSVLVQGNTVVPAAATTRYGINAPAGSVAVGNRLGPVADYATAPIGGSPTTTYPGGTYGDNFAT